MSARDPLCLALDGVGPDEAVALVERTHRAFRVFKIGLELFSAAGPAIIERVRRAGADEVFLDLKLHDIPQTVAHAARALRPLGVDYLTVHVGGGRAMLEAAMEAGVPLLGVTVLTSLDAAALAETGVTGGVEPLLAARADLARSTGLHGVVCSAADLARLRRPAGETLRFVTPGIRPAGSALGDQRRVATPAEALRDGADLLVVGRPVTAAPDPELAIAALHAEVAAALRVVRA